MLLRIALLLLSYSSLCGALPAASLTVFVRDAKGIPVANAVVYSKPNGASASSRERRQVVIDQQNKEFVPYVTAIQVGTSVVLPNKDDIRHHVYSFSPAKSFELPLYSGTPANPVLFDKEGFVTLGCNIHDWMVAYVAVVATPFFQVTGEDGRAILRNLPAGHSTVAVWQPRMKGSPEKSAQKIDLSAGGEKEIMFTIDLKPNFRGKRAPVAGSKGYR